MNQPSPWKRRLRRFFVFLGLLIALDLVIRTDWVERPAARLLETGIELATGERALVGGVEFQPAIGELAISGLVLSHVMETGETSPVIAIESIVMQLGFPRKGSFLRRVKIDNPVVSLHVDDDGLREFRNMAPAKSRSQNLPWRWIQINNARIELFSAAGSVLLAGINLETTERDAVDIGVNTARVRVGELDEVGRQVRLEGVRFSPAGLSVEDFRVESQHTHVQGRIEAVFGGPLSGHVNVSVALPVLDAFVAETKSFEGTGHADFEFLGTVREPVVRGSILVADLIHRSLAVPEKPKKLELERLVGQVEIDGRHLKIDSADITWAEGRLSAKGAVDLVSRGIAIDLGLEGISLRSAIRQAGGHVNSWADFRADGEGSVGGTLSPFKLTGSYDLAVADLDVGTGPPGGASTKPILQIPSIHLVGDLDTGPDGIWLRSKSVKSGATSGKIDAFIGFNSNGPLDITYDLDRASLATFRPLKGLDLFGYGRLRGTVIGPFKEVKFTATGAVRDFHMLGLPLADQAQVSFVCNDLRTLEFQQFSGVLGSSEFRGRADVYISDETTMDVRVETENARVGDLLAIGRRSLPWLDGRISGMLHMVGDPSTPNGDIDAVVRDVEIFGESFPSGHMKGWLDRGVVMVDELGLKRWNGEESLLARGSITLDWDANLEVTGTGFRLERLNNLMKANLPMSADLAVDAVVRGKLIDPEPVGRLAVRNMTYAGQAVPDSTIEFETTKAGVAFTGSMLAGGMSIDGLIPAENQDRFSLTADLQEFPFHTMYPKAANGRSVKAIATGQITILGEWGSDQPHIDISGRGDAFELSWDRHTLKTDGPWTFAMTGREMRLRGFRLTGTGTELSWDLSSDESGQLSGWGGGFIDADLARMFVPGLSRSDGTIALKVGVSGSHKKPRWEVDGAFHDVTMQGDWFPHPIEGILGVVSVNPDSTHFRGLEPMARDADWIERDPVLAEYADRLARLDGLRATLGGGSVRVDGGWTSVGWSPTAFDMTGTVTNGRVQYLDDFPPAVGSASLTFDGPVGELLLAGRVDVSEMAFNDRISWEDSLLQPSIDGTVGLTLDEEEPWFSMDLDLVSNNSIKIRNNLADLVAGGTLKVVGDTKQPGLVGNIRCEPGGTVYIKEREFEVQRAELHFVDPFTYDPDVDLLLATEIRSRDERYDINYRVSGTYNDWRAETRSEPSLPQADVNALLLFGMTRAELERYGGLGGAIALEGGDLLASSVLFTGLDDPDRGGLFRIVDPFRPERLDLVSGVSERGSGIVTSELRLLYENELADVGLPGTMMIFEQNISRSTDTYLGIEQRLARTLYARTYWGSEQVGRYMDLGGAYGFDVKVRWEVD